MDPELKNFCKVLLFGGIVFVCGLYYGLKLFFWFFMNYNQPGSYAK